MGYRLAMSSEIRDWLADLSRSEPQTALAVGKAVAALISGGADVGPPLAVPLSDPSLPRHPPEALDQAYQDSLARLTEFRRVLADAATLATDVDLEIADLEARQGPEWKLTELRRLQPGVHRAEQQLASAVRRMQAETDAFRTRKEVLKARYVAADAMGRVDESIAELRDHEPGLADSGAPRGDASGTAATLREVSDEIERELSREGRAAGLTELRPGGPAADIRIVFAVEPAGTALLISVLHGRDAVLDDRGAAARISADVLRRVRVGLDVDATACSYENQQEFVAAFFPGVADQIVAGAAAEAATSRVRLLADQRARLGLTLDQVALRMGVSRERAGAIESAGPGTAEIRELAGYVEALGGRLDVVADFAGERVVLR